MLDNIIGFYKVLRLKNNVYFKRFSKLKLYRLKYNRKLGGIKVGIKRDREGVNKVWEDN